MPPVPRAIHAYKDTTLSQLRSFCATARLGSFTAAAASLGLAHPTVWKQVHALEQEFGTKLVETNGRGCRLTAAGRLLAQLAGPSVAGIVSLKQQFDEALSQSVSRLVVAATPRVLVEDLSGPVVEFERRMPDVYLTFKELHTDEVAPHVESRNADLGFTPLRGPQTENPWLVFEPCYELDIVLITPQDHPLASRRSIRLHDLCAYPLVNSPDAFHDTAVRAILEEAGAFATQPRRVEAYFATTVRRYVELGFGIGLLPRSPASPPHGGLHERSVSHLLGRWTCFVVWRKGENQPAAARFFVEEIRALMERPREATRR